MKFFIVFLASLVLVNAQLNPSNCGLRPLAPATFNADRIVGGKEAIPGDWGWQVSLTNGGRHFCGGVLIDQSWVLTAAHCFASTPTSLQVDIGVHDRNIKETWVITRSVSKIIKHPSYQSNPPRNDITLLKLTTPVTFDNKYYIPACVPDGTENFQSYVSWITGWGTRQLNGALITKLNEVSVPILTDARCKTRYGTNINIDSAICAGENAVNLGPCQGDSGGPLVVKSKVDGRWYVIGLTSWGFDCGNGGVFTRVSFFKNWILQNIAANP